MLEGRALARLTDLGWGGTLRSVFAVDAPDAPASPAMLAACVRVLADWGWADRPVGVVAMPSRSHPQLVDSVARGLAAAGRLDYLGALEYAAPPQGGPGGNSAFRLAQVFDAFTVPFPLPAGPVLLVDDLADSRWTLTVASRLLLRAGRGRRAAVHARAAVAGAPTALPRRQRARSHGRRRAERARSSVVAAAAAARRRGRRAAANAGAAVAGGAQPQRSAARCRNRACAPGRACDTRARMPSCRLRRMRGAAPLPPSDRERSLLREREASA